jgi:hypothetical protein
MNGHLLIARLAFAGCVLATVLATLSAWEHRPILYLINAIVLAINGFLVWFNYRKAEETK